MQCHRTMGYDLPIRSLLSLGLLLLATSVAAQPVAGSCFEARFLDVGQGDAAIVRAGTGESMLVDAGPHAATAELLRAVRALGRTPEVVVLSHPHADHVGGAAALLAGVRPARIVDPGFPFGSKIYRATLTAVRALGQKLQIGRRGQRFMLGPRVTVDVLAPEEPLIARSRSDANANSIVLRVRCGAVTALFAGDAERPTEGRLLAHGDLAAEVLKVAHHGSRYASSDPFLQAVHPRVAVISCGRANRFGHPARETVARLERIGARVLRTDLHGDIVVRTDGQEVEALGSRSPQSATR